MPRRRDEAKTEPLKIVERVAERVDFEFAGIARTGVDVADGETSPERPLGRRFHGGGESQEFRIVVRGRTLSQRRPEALQQRFAHLRGRIPNRSS